MSQESPLHRLVRRGTSRFARSLAFLVPLLASAAALAGPSAPYAPPRDVSTEGHRVTWLFWYTTGLGIVAFTLVCASLAFIVARYRARAGHRAVYDKGTDRRSLLVTGSLAVLVFLSIDLVLVHRSRADIEEYLTKWPTAADTVRIEVMPQQWAWNFRYAGADGVFNTADDVVTLNEMWIPKGRPVFLNLKAKDVIHSFYVPNFRLKQDANPGQVTRMWFQAKETGSMEIACSQLCGWAHYKMKADLTVMENDAFERWYAEAQGDAKRRFDPADTEAQWGWEWVSK
jgi:cytochrome c oxidase subunit 2